MFKKSLARAGATGVAFGALLAVGALAPAEAAPMSVSIDVVAHTAFDSTVNPFGGNIPGCETGTVAEGPSTTHFTSWGGVYTGVKEFTCAGGEGGVDVRLSAVFGDFGSRGKWHVLDGWGFLDGVKASGTLIGTATANGIDDRYIGSAR
ncbi:hypothetical protein L1277_001099 [Okibacterium sp. HSC-33S16]|uniref:hypothetical protein n=1 Tax=Okibacterium sp. HSC-33S16 TaxID=2910965 RepID=UPI00209DE2F0|nr:hypothetical protein [Okibacterium sp. HSC-33S16]MCP2031008.1 hypothetical protein [Okibacterium sp. HSC-33S16]